MIKNSVDRLAYRESLQDGLADMMMASFFIVPAVVVDRPAMNWLFLVPLLLLGPVHRTLRRRYVEPRLGYAELQGEKPGRLFLGIACFGVGVVAILALILLGLGDIGDPGQWRRWAAGLAGVMFAGGLLYAGRRSGLPSYHLLALISAIGGILLALFIDSGSYRGLRVYLLGMGVIVFCFGLLRFTRFIRNNPIRQEESNGHQ